MNNTHPYADSLVVITTTVIGTFMVFFMCFALRMCFLNTYVRNKPIELQPPPYQESSETPPDYISSCTQTLVQEPHPQAPPEHLH